MARLRVREQAEARGINMSQLHTMINKRQDADKPVAMGTIRRYWYSTKDGKQQGPAIELVDVHLLGTIARALGVSLFDLMNEDELGNNELLGVAVEPLYA